MCCIGARRYVAGNIAVSDLLRAMQGVWRERADASQLDALLLLERASGRARSRLLAYDECDLNETALRWLQQAVERRAAGEPLAYILGSVGFYGREFFVDARVLVPRPETEHLIDDAVTYLRVRGMGRRPLQLCDVGTGSGCIAVTLASEFPQSRVLGLDISPPALEVALGNAERFAVADRVTFVRSDLLAAVPREQRFDLIIANLPYLPSAAVPCRPDPLGFEPALALDGGADGLGAYRRLIAQLRGHLAEEALVLLEAAPPTMDALHALMLESHLGGRVTTEKDYAGLVRYVRYERRGERIA